MASKMTGMEGLGRDAAGNALPLPQRTIGQQTRIGYKKEFGGTMAQGGEHAVYPTAGGQGPGVRKITLSPHGDALDQEVEHQTNRAMQDAPELFGKQRESKMIESGGLKGHRSQEWDFVPGGRATDSEAQQWRQQFRDHPNLTQYSTSDARNVNIMKDSRTGNLVNIDPQAWYTQPNHPRVVSGEPATAQYALRGRTTPEAMKDIASYSDPIRGGTPAAKPGANISSSAATPASGAPTPQSLDASQIRNAGRASPPAVQQPPVPESNVRMQAALADAHPVPPPNSMPNTGSMERRWGGGAPAAAPAAEGAAAARPIMQRNLLGALPNPRVGGMPLLPEVTAAGAAKNIGVGMIPGAIAGAAASGEGTKWTFNPAQMVRNVAADPGAAAGRFGNTFPLAARGAWETGIRDPVVGMKDLAVSGAHGLANSVMHPIDTAKANLNTAKLFGSVSNPATAVNNPGGFAQSLRDIGSGFGVSGAQNWFGNKATPAPHPGAAPATAPAAAPAAPTPAPSPAPSPAPVPAPPPVKLKNPFLQNPQ